MRASVDTLCDFYGFNKMSIGVLGIFWSVKNNQYDDLKMNSEKILYNESKKHE